MSRMVCCVGELMWDFCPPPAQSLATAKHFRRSIGGAAGNVAMHLRALGIRTAISGVLSRDALGVALRDALKAQHVDTENIRFQNGQTGLFFFEQGGKKKGNVAVVRSEFKNKFTRLALPQRFSNDLLHIAALPSKSSEQRALIKLATQANARDAFVSIDLNARPGPWQKHKFGQTAARLLSMAHLIKASHDDLINIGHQKNDAKTLRQLWQLQQATVIVTRGHQTTTAAGPWGHYRRKPPRITMVHAVGAGDAFCARLLAAIASANAIDRQQAPLWHTALTAAQEHATRHVATTYR